MNGLTIFDYGDLCIRSVMLDNEPWFVGKDVASALGYANTKKAIIDHVDPEDKRDGVTICDPIGRKQTPIIINESGMYALIFGSKLEQAKKFKHWVTHEVLPAIRKTGSYSKPEYDKMEVAKMIVDCKSAAAVKCIMKLFDQPIPVRNASGDRTITDFIDTHTILNRTTQEVYREYQVYCLEHNIPKMDLHNFSRKINQILGTEVKRHRVNGKLTGFYVKG